MSSDVLKVGAIDVWTGTNMPANSNFVAGIAIDIGRHPFLTFSATADTPYQLRVVGTNTGNFTLKITATNAPIVVVQPLSRTVSAGESAFFGVVAGGNPPFFPAFSYQWRSNGIDLPGETFPILPLDHLSTNQSAAYSVRVSNGVAATLSADAVLNVTEISAPPSLNFASGSGGRFLFEIAGDRGRLYRVFSSTNLFDWSEEKSFPEEFIYYNTTRQRNGLVYGSPNLLSVPQSSQRRFYRTLNYVPPLAGCINNLGSVRFAKEIWSLEKKHAGANTVPAPSDIAPYLKNGGPLCPLAGGFGTFETSYGVGALTANPTCKISSNHILEEPEY